MKNKSGATFIAAVCTNCLRRVAWVAARPDQWDQIVWLSHVHQCCPKAKDNILR